MTVMCKFKCFQVVKAEGYEAPAFHPVRGKGNEEWSKWTPSGKLEITITNPNIFGKFVPGKDYYLKISDVVEVEDV